MCATYPNEEFAVDLHRCQNTCQYYGRKWDCPLNYKPFGDCYCKRGFARIADDYGKCVSVTNNVKCVAQLPIQPGNVYIRYKLTVNNACSALSYECI